MEYSAKIPNKQDILMVSLTNYFRTPSAIGKMLPIIQGKSNISLRIIDWFVTNFSKKNNTCVWQSIEELDKLGEPVKNAKQFLVFLNYKSQLKAYTKKQFDPFCRRNRIQFYYSVDNPNDFIMTTVGQLNFFRWAISNNILDYIEENLSEIETDMNQCIRTIYNQKKGQKESKEGKCVLAQKQTKRKKRRELSKSATKTINRHSVNITISFE